MFGCPSTGKSCVFPAKRLRKFFEVPENTVRHITCINTFAMFCDLYLYIHLLTHVIYNFIFLQVCGKCILRESCKFANQNVWKCDANKLDLELVMKVVISYALHLVHPQLVVSDEVNKSVNHLLNEFVKLSTIT